MKQKKEQKMALTKHKHSHNKKYLKQLCFTNLQKKSVKWINSNLEQIIYLILKYLFELKMVTNKQQSFSAYIFCTRSLYQHTQREKRSVTSKLDSLLFLGFQLIDINKYISLVYLQHIYQLDLHYFPSHMYINIQYLLIYPKCHFTPNRPLNISIKHVVSSTRLLMNCV